jgi:hypothetical protein
MLRSAFGIRIPLFYLCIVLLINSSLIAFTQVCPKLTISMPGTQLYGTGLCPNLTSTATGGPRAIHLSVLAILPSRLFDLECWRRMNELKK